jgi:hypothetical protein
MQIATIENEIYASEKETEEQIELLTAKKGSIEQKLSKVEDKSQFLGGKLESLNISKSAIAGIISSTNDRLIEKKMFNQRHSKRYLPK